MKLKTIVRYEDGKPVIKEKRYIRCGSILKEAARYCIWSVDEVGEDYGGSHCSEDVTERFIEIKPENILVESHHFAGIMMDVRYRDINGPGEYVDEGEKVILLSDIDNAGKNWIKAGESFGNDDHSRWNYSEFSLRRKKMIRRAMECDIAGVNSLLQQVLTVHANGRPDIFIPGTTKYTGEELLAIFENDDTPVFVSTDDEGNVIGHAFGIFEEIRDCNNMHDMKSLYIDDICVDEAHRGQGVATELYETMKKHARDNGCYHMTLNVWEINPDAKKFYEAMGMKPLKTVMEEIL